ncbi:ethanolamine utilization protein EutH [Alteribacillus sp. HJP-4]|uniref:ethanolamine utilization protein EutH n=1 Tax=Alteribacillus sp. HJP-4 TaxID=2775394 RepID=UPI0035CCCA31
MPGLQEIVLLIIAWFAVIGAVDKMRGNPRGYGEEFEKGFAAMGPLAIVMIGMISLAPVLASLLKPAVVPVYQFFGADPAMFATSLLALDMGGYALAGELAESEDAARFAGILLGTMLGPTLTFTVPVALGIIERKDREHLAKGILAGIITIPIGLLAGGAAAGFSLGNMVSNTIPVLLFSLIVLAGLMLNSAAMIAAFQVLGRFVLIFTTAATTVVLLETVLNITIIPGMAPPEEGIVTVGTIALTLAGAFPMVSFIKIVLRKSVWTEKHTDGQSLAGIVSSLAHAIPMFVLSKDMNEKGKVVNFAFAVSGAFVLGGHLAFTAAVDREMIQPMIIGKLTAGVTAILMALFLLRQRKH